MFQFQVHVELERRVPKTLKTPLQGFHSATPGLVPNESLRAPLKARPRLTETGRSRISRANCPRWPGSPGERLDSGRQRPALGQSASSDILDILNGQIVTWQLALSAEIDP
jgi:hypothetical protein